MQLTPWRKRRGGELTRFREDIYDLMDRFLAGIPSAESTTEWVPFVDISETDGEFNVRAELPGLDKNDLDVDVSGDVLSIKGEKKDEEEKKDKGYYMRESYFGSFQRNIRLPAEVQRDQVEATFKDGILNITIPKSEEKKARKIQIT
jgi:HSP20 family protein